MFGVKDSNNTNSHTFITTAVAAPGRHLRHLLPPIQGCNTPQPNIKDVTVFETKIYL